MNFRPNIELYIREDLVVRSSLSKEELEEIKEIVLHRPEVRHCGCLFRIDNKGDIKGQIMECGYHTNNPKKRD